MEFLFPEDQKIFQKLLCDEHEDLSKYESLFDFRPPILKRQEFNKIMKQVRLQLENLYGRVCQLQCSNLCNIERGINIDHLIPLSSNKLNKELRQLKALKGKKVLTQSFGSNNLSNLVLACKKCNSYKKHRFLSKAELKRILDLKNL
jgi:5-methylcytosine-specific restriction endonuclease McrA